MLQLIQSLSPAEGEKLHQFLQSPYFNEQVKALELFEALYQYAPNRWEELPEKLVFFRKEWPGEIWDRQKTDYLMSQLNKQAEHFLAIQEVQQEEALLQTYLLEALSRKGLRKAYRQISKQWEQHQKTDTYHDKHRYFLKLRYEQVQDADFGRTRQRKDDRTIERHAVAFDHYYFASRLSLACIMLDRQAILNTRYELNLSTAWMTHLKNNQFFGQPIIEIYFTIYQTLIEQQNPDHFLRLKALLRTYQHTIARQELADIYLLAINYCLRQMRQQKTNFMREALNLYEAGIESKTLYKDGYLSPWTFTNVIKLFLGVREYNKAEAFIKQYGSAMPPDFSENAVRYNLAELYYYTQRYDEAQVQLNQVEYTDPNFYLGARELLAKIYYETGAEESLLSMIASFTMFLKRNKKLSNNLKQPYLNFCRVLLKIVRRSKRDQATLEQELSETPLLASRHWLQKIAKEARS